MGIIQTPCSVGFTNQLTLDGRILEYSSLKEILRQLPFAIQGNIVNNKQWIFQRVLDNVVSSAIFPAADTVQFYTGGTAKPLNSTEGPDNSNFKQPNFILIATDAPVKVTFGFSDTVDLFLEPGPLTPLVPQPFNINKSVIVNGYFVKDSNSFNKIAPATVAEVTTWNYSGRIGGVVPGTWAAALGMSDSSITWPIKVEKSSQFTCVSVLIYACVLA